MPVEDPSEPVGFRQVTEPTEEGLDTGTGQEPKSNSDEGLTEEPVDGNQGRRYPLRERRVWY